MIHFTEQSKWNLLFLRQIHILLLNLKVYGYVKILKCKSFLLKVTLWKGQNKFLWLKKLKLLYRGHV